MAAGQIIRRTYTRALFQIGLPLLIATSTGLADNSLLNPQPNFAGVPGGGVTANAGNCFLGDASAAGGAIGGTGSALDLTSLGIKGKGAGGADPSACGVKSIPDSSSISCDSASVQTDGNFDPAKLQARIDDLASFDGKTDDDEDDTGGGKNGKNSKNSSSQSDATGGSLGCELNSFNKIKQEMSCVQNQGQLLAQQIGALAQIYQQNITRYQKDDQAYKQREGDRQSQLDAIQKLLGGNKNSGTKGLLQEQSDLQKLVNDTMPQDIAAALAQSKTVANQRAIILENVQKHTMSLTGDCFKTNPKAGYKCTPGGPDLSPENYIVCMYGKYAHVKNGQYVQGALADSNANSSQNTLQGILDQMTNTTALSYQTPTDPTSASATALKPSFGNTIQDLINNFVNQTAGMTVNGISVSTTITNELQSCYLAAQAEVASERTDPSSAISQAQFQQTQSETALKAGFDQKLEAYSQKWTEAMGVLSQQNLPLNLSNCKSQDITYEGNCLTDVQNQLTGLLKGDASQAPFTMNVPAQFPDTQIPVTALQCRGINGCVTQLQAVNDQVTQAKTTLTTGREAYETQARQSTDQFTQQVAALLNNQSAQLRKQLASINGNLQGLGVSGNIGFPNVPSAKMEYETNQDGSQGLPKMPDNIMGLISGKMSPPMMDLTDNSNNDGSAIAGGIKKVRDNMDKVEKDRSAWEAKMTECEKDSINSAFTTAAQNLIQCSNFCTQYQTDAPVMPDDPTAQQAADPNYMKQYNQRMTMYNAQMATYPSNKYMDVSNTDNLFLSDLYDNVLSAENDLNTDNSGGSIQGNSKAKQAAINQARSTISSLVSGCKASTGSASEISDGNTTVACPGGADTQSSLNDNPKTRGHRTGGKDNGTDSSGNAN